MSKLTVSPPRRLSKLSEVSTPLWWKKYSLPSSAAKNPNPRSETIFFTVPFGIARSPPLEHRIERIGPVRERRMPAAREITRRPGDGLHSTTVTERALPTLGGDPKAQADEHQPGGRLHRPANPISTQEIADSGHHHGIEGQPGDRDAAEDQAKQQQAGKGRLPARHELWEQAKKEDDDLGVAEVADEALPVCRTPPPPRPSPQEGGRNS